MKPLFTLFGVPVRIEPMFFLIPLLSLSSRDLASAAVWTGLVFSGVLLHEFGHALTMKRFGFAPSITLHGLGGLTHFPRGAQPTPRQRFFITLAGPGAGLALGSLVFLAQRLVPQPAPLVSLALADALWINVGWSVVNLLPILPWDGGLVLDAGLEWATGKRRDRVVALTSIVGGGAIVALAFVTRNILLGYFGGMGLLQGYGRLKGPQTPPAANWWERIHAGEDVEKELEAGLRAETDPAQRAYLAELLAWARMRKRDFEGARRAVKQMGPFVPSLSLRARLAAADNDPDTVLALLSPEGAASDTDLPLLVSALLSRERFDDVVKLGRKVPLIADLAATRLFGEKAFAQALELCTAERARTGQGRFAYNEACCYARLGRLDDAVTALQQAKTLGCAELAGLRTDEDLEPIRDRPEVQALLNG